MIRLLLIIVLFCFNTLAFAQQQTNRIVFRTGLSHATQQWGVSPLSHIRPPNKGIQSGYLFLGYDCLKSTNLDLVIGIQYAEKGFRIKYEYENPGRLKQEAAYQYLLQYIEVPLNFRYRIERFFLSGGFVLSYLVNDVYSYREKIISYDRYRGTSTEFNIAYELSYNELYDRINKFDFGVMLGTSYLIKENVEFDLNIQKHFLQVDNWKQRDLVYNLIFLSGIKLNF